MAVLHELPPLAAVLRFAEVVAFWGESSGSGPDHPTDTHTRSADDSRGSGTRDNRMLHDDAARNFDRASAGSRSSTDSAHDC
jgi:hypothetical protein